ncbi:MAG: FG-GAP-like repeat-containing protein [Bacteroidales bacterium]
MSIKFIVSPSSTTSYYVVANKPSLGSKDCAEQKLTDEITVTVAVIAVNDDYSTLVGYKGNSIAMSVLDNDEDVISPTSITILTGGQHFGTASVSSSGDSVIYTVGATDTFGIDSFMYKCHSRGCEDSAWVYVVLTDIPDNIVKFDCEVSLPTIDFGTDKIESPYDSLLCTSVPIVGDLTGDGKSNIVALGYHEGWGWESNVVHVFDASSWNKPKYTYEFVDVSAAIGRYSISIADIDPADNKREIFCITSNTYMRDTMFLNCLTVDPSEGIKLKWRVPKINYTVDGNTKFETGIPTPIIRDINGDGKVEIVLFNRIYDAANGDLLSSGVDMDFRSTGHSSFESVIPAVSDVDNDGIKEIALGNIVYKPSKDLKSMSEWRKINRVDVANYEVEKEAGGHTAFVDVDNDGIMEVCVITRVGGTGQNRGIVSYAWNLESERILGKLYYGRQMYGASPLTISDIDGDGMPEIVLMAGGGSEAPGVLHCYEWDSEKKGLAERWSMETADGSQSTTVSSFDFDNDGKKEIVYRSEDRLRLLSDNGKGKNPVDLGSLGDTGGEASSATHSEYPVIVDFDNNGVADILLIDNIYKPWNADGGKGDRQRAKLVIYGSATPGAWSSARKVWNSYAYSPININEDLTVPRYPASILTEMPESKDKKPFNTFLCQVPYMSSTGVVIEPGVDLSIESVDWVMGRDSMTFTLNVSNLSEDVDFASSDSALAIYCREGNELLYVAGMPTIYSSTELLSFDIKVPMDSLRRCASENLVFSVADRGRGEGEGVQGDCNYDNNKDTIHVTLCSQHQIPDMTIGACLAATDYNINMLSYVAYADLDSISIWDENGVEIADPESVPASNLKVNNTTVFTYYYEKTGFCVGSEHGKIYINGFVDDGYANLKNKEVSVCASSLKNGGYNLNSIMPYATKSGTWNVSNPEEQGTTVDAAPYFAKDENDGWVFDAKGYWSAVEGDNRAVEEISVTVEYSTGADDMCAGANKTASLTLRITRD